MIPREILKQVRRIEISTRGLVNEVFSGEYHSVFKGRGMNFAEVREYQYGDDIRSIDWNVTARSDTPFVKIFEEERELTVMLVVDVSASGDFGSKERLKGEVAVEICALLAFSAIKNNDKVGLIIFSDRIEKFVPPRKGRRHVLRVLRELLYHRPEGRGTDIAVALEYLTHVQRKKAVTFLVSDFRDDGFEKALAVAGRRHDLIAVRVGDEREEELPAIGFLEVEDPESGERLVIDTSNPRFRTAFAAGALDRRDRLDRALRRGKVDVIDIRTGTPYVKSLMRFFQGTLPEATVRARAALTAACLALVVAVVAAPVAGQARVRTSVDTTLVTVGDRITMTVGVDHPAGTSVAWPDSVNLAPFEVLDARLLADEAGPEGTRSTMQLALTVFELGELEIPSFDVSVVGPDGGVEVLSTDRFGVEVVSVGADETGDIREIRGPLLIPLSAVWLAGLLLLFILLAVLASFLYRRFRSKDVADAPAPGPPPRPAHEVALEALDRLQASPMLGRGEVKEFHIEASEIVRRYVEARFSVPALEMTTWEVVEGLERTGVDLETREVLRGFLDRCDLVKFAKVRPSSDDARTTLQHGRDLVERTVAHMTGVA